MRKRHSDWPEHRQRAWEATRARGRKHYIWWHGVLTWGGFMFCFSLGVYHYRHYGSVLSTDGGFLLRLLVGALVWTYVGYLYGRASWHQNEREYTALTRTADKSART